MRSASAAESAAIITKFLLSFRSFTEKVMSLLTELVEVCAQDIEFLFQRFPLANIQEPKSPAELL